MKVGEVVHDRFEVIEAPRQTDEVVVRDRMTGQRALTLRPGLFLDDASSFAMASHVRTLDASDLAEVLALNPTVLALGEDEGRPTPAEMARLTLDLIERCFALLEDGVVAQPRYAWIVRSDGGLRFRMPAGLVGAYGLNFDNRSLTLRWTVESILIEGALASFSQRVPTGVLRARDAAQAVAVLAHWDVGLRERSLRGPSRLAQRLDLDDAERRGRARRATLARSDHYVDWPLAAVIHRRACVAAQNGDPVRALAGIDEALALDPHARYFTTRALLLEALVRDDEAERAHEAAVKALPESFLSADSLEETRIIEGNESVHDPRTAHAYGAFLARRGQLEQAVVWLRHATRPQPAWLGVDPFAASRHAALAGVLFRLGQRDEARTAAGRALSIDAEEPSARAVLAALERG